MDYWEHSALHPGGVGNIRRLFAIDDEAEQLSREWAWPGALPEVLRMWPPRALHPWGGL